MFKIIGLIIVIIIIIVDKNKKKNNQTINNIKPINMKYCPSCGKEIKNNNNKFCTNCGKSLNNYSSNDNNIQQEVLVKKTAPKKKMSEKEIKNNSILITGSILIILSAIIFLTSSWTVINNPTKCIIIFALLIVFILISYFAKNKFHLNNTARAFKYIYLVYFLLALLSLSVFNLIGTSLSNGGEYQDTYIAITLLISSVIYFLEARHDKDKAMSIASIITSVMGIIMLVDSITNYYQITIIGLFLYSIFLALLYKNKIILYSEEFHNNIVQILTILLLILSFYTVAIKLITQLEQIEYIINVVLLMISFVSICMTNYKKEERNTLLEIVFISISATFARMFNLENIYFQLVIILSISILVIYDYMKEKVINTYTFIISTMSLLGIFIMTAFLNIISKDPTIPLYIITLLYTGLLLITFKCNEKAKEIISWLMPIFIEIDTVLLVLEYNINYNVLFAVTLLLLSTALIPKFKNYSKNIIMVSSITSVLIIVSTYTEKSFITLILLIILCALYYLLSSKIKREYKYILYVFINITFIYLGNIMLKGLMPHALAISTIIVISLEYINKDFADKDNFIFILINYVLSAILLFGLEAKTAFIMTLIISIILLEYMIENKKDINLLAIPLLTPILYIVLSDVFVINGINYMLLFSLLLIIIPLILVIRDKEYKVLAYIPYVYVGGLFIIETNLYIIGIELFIISIIYYMFTDKKLLFKLLALGSSLIVYYQLLKDFSVEYTLIKFGVLLLYGLFITRNILKDRSESKSLEYLFNIIINALAIFSFKSELDGILYVSLLLILVIYSYIRKYGPTFLISLVFIIINTFLLTREFWFSLPWWLYILLLGIILVTFAIRNEAMEKSDIKKKINNFKKKLNI